MRLFLLKVLVRVIAMTHLMIIGLNMAAIPFIIIYEPFYLWMPIVTVLVSPMMGGSYCMFNRLENHYRDLAGMPLIHDRLGAVFSKKYIIPR